MYDEFFYKRLTDLRLQKGVSAREMSLSLGQNAGYINNIENRKAMPSMNGFFYICDYLGVTPQEFFDMENIAPTEFKELTGYLRRLDRAKLSTITALVKEMIK